MKRSPTFRRHGSVVVMVTMSIILLLAAAGLVADIGWAYFIRRSAQVAADAAAQAGAKKALEKINGGVPVLAGDADVANAAVAYATTNGFTTGGSGGRQTVDISSSPDKTLLPAQLQPLLIRYWVQAKVKGRTPAFFMPGSAGMDSGAVAIAAVLLEPLEGSILLLNRTCDPQTNDCTVPDNSGGMGKGVDLNLQGGVTVNAPRGILINSSANGDSRTQNKYALMSGGGGNGQVTAPYIMFALDGSFQGAPDPGAKLLPPVISGAQITDPTLQMNNGRQPQVKTVDDLVNPGKGGNGVVYGVTGSLGGGGQPAVLGPGVYIGGTVTAGGKGQPPKFIFSDQPIDLSNVVFQNPGSTPGTFIFLGGISSKSANITLAPGTYVAAGGPSGTALDLKTSVVKDNGGGSYGELFLLTRPDFTPAGGAPSAGNPILLDPAASYNIQPLGIDGQAFGSLVPNVPFAGPAAYPFGDANMKSGVGNGNTQMSGLKGRAPCFPDTCAAGDPQMFLYQPILFWQDRCNSPFAASYAACAARQPGTDASAAFNTDATALAGMNGVVYQPRGGWMNVVAGSNATQAPQIITGAMAVGPGGGTVDLPPGPVPTLVLTVALIR